MFIFDDHKAYYMWYRELVKEWLVDVWDELHQSKPAWFVDEIKNIPLELIPNISLESVREEMGIKEDETINSRRSEQRRRSSAPMIIADILGGVKL